MAKKRKAQTPVEKAYSRERNRIKRFIRDAEKRGYRFSDFSIPDKPKKITEASVRILQKYNPKYLYEKATFLDPDTGEIVSGQRGRHIERKESARKAKETRRIKRIYGKLTPEEVAEREEKQMERHLRGEDTEEYRKQKDEEIQRLQDELAELQERLRKLTGEEPDEGVDEEPEIDIPEQHDDFSNIPRDKMPKFNRTVLEGIREELRRWTPQPNWTTTLSEVKAKDKNKLERILDGAIASEGERTVAERLQNNADEVNALVQEILYASGDTEGNFKNGRTQVNFDLARFSAIIMGRPLTVDESIDLTELAETMELEN